MEIIFNKLADGLDPDEDGVIPSAGVIMVAMSLLAIAVGLAVVVPAAAIDAAGWSLPLDLARAIPDKVWLAGVIGNVAFCTLGVIMAVPIIAKAQKQGRCLCCGASRN